MIKLSRLAEKVNPRGIEVRPIRGGDEQSTFEIMVRKHYLGGANKSINVRFGIFADGQMVGIVAYGPPTYPMIARQLNMQSNEIYEMRRFYTDESHRIYNLESQAISLANDELKHIKPEIKVVVTYADPNQGHLGKLYQATNAIYLGRGKGIGGKHKYIYLIGSTSDKRDTLKRIKIAKQDYPKEELQEFQVEGFDLDEFLNIKSFSGKIRYANSKLKKLAAGSARIIYEIDNDTVLKVAKNNKGLAQNEVEIGLGTDYYAKHIVAEILEYDDDFQWLVMKRAKKITPNRFKELMDGIDILNFYYYIKSKTDLRAPRGQWAVRPEIEEKLDENEFAQDLVDLILNYNIHAGDFQRLSTFGEIDGNITVIDYGLSDEIYKKHYDKRPKQRYY